MCGGSLTSRNLTPQPENWYMPDRPAPGARPATLDHPGPPSVRRKRRIVLETELDHSSPDTRSAMPVLGTLALLAAGFAAHFAPDPLPSAGPLLFALAALIGPLVLPGRSAAALAGLGVALALAACASALWQATPAGATLALLLLDLAALGLPPATLRLTGKLHAKPRARAFWTDDIRSFADAVPLVLWVSEPSGKLIYLSRRFSECTGIDAEAALRTNSWHTPIWHEDLPGYKAYWEETRRKGTEGHTHMRVRQANGTYKWMHTVGTPVRAPKTGEIIFWVGGLLDVDQEIRARETIGHLVEKLQRSEEIRTQKLELTEWRHRVLYDDKNFGVAEQNFSGCLPILAELRAKGVTNLREYLLAHPEVIAACAAVWKTIDVNDTILRMLHAESREQVVMRPPRESVTNGTEVFILQLEAIYEGRESANGTTVLLGADGSRVHVAFFVNFRPDGTAYSTLFDIGVQARTHELMLGVQKELARVNRAATVGALSISIVHELNQPLTSIAVDVDNLSRALTAEAPDLALLRRLSGRLTGTTARLSSLVQATRNKIARRKGAEEPTDLRRLLNETHALLADEITNRRALVRIDCPDDLPPVVVERVQLQQVIINLVMNALEAMECLPPDLRNVQIRLARTEAGNLSFAVADSGPGIDTALQEKIFEPLFTTKSGGIGMGLQICKSSVDEMGGHLSVRNGPEGGAVFEFSLPLTGT